jgi:hypothetical protein
MTFLFDVLHNRADYGEYIACYPELLARSATPEDARRRMRAFAVEEVKSIKEARLVLHESQGSEADLTGTPIARARTMLERDFVVAYEAAVTRGASNHGPDA